MNITSPSHLYVNPFSTSSSTILRVPNSLERRNLLLRRLPCTYLPSTSDLVLRRTRRINFLSNYLLGRQFSRHHQGRLDPLLDLPLLTHLLYRSNTLRSRSQHTHLKSHSDPLLGRLPCTYLLLISYTFLRRPTCTNLSRKWDSLLYRLPPPHIVRWLYLFRDRLPHKNSHVGDIPS